MSASPTPTDPALEAPGAPRPRLPGDEQPQSAVREPALTSLRERALRAGAWTISGYGAGYALALASNVILAHLLFREAFGLMAVVAVFVQALQQFSDMGIGPSIIQNRRGEEQDFLNTAWTMQIIRGIVLWIIACVLAYPLAMFYEEPRIVELLPVAALSALITGMASPKRFTLNRNLRVARLAMIDLIAQSIAASVGIVWALIERTIWALVAMHVVGSFINMSLTHLVIEGPDNRLRFDRSAARELVGFGKWVLFNTMMGFIASQSDRMIMGKLLSWEVIGVYYIAFRFASVPRALITKLSQTVVFPAIADKQGLPRIELRAKIAQRRWPILLIGAAALSLAVTISDQMILLFYDDRYVQAAWMLPVLLLGLWPLVAGATVNPALLAIGRPKDLFIGSAIRLPLVIAGIILAHHYFGLPGIVFVVALAMIPRYLVALIAGMRAKLILGRQDLLALVLFAAMTATMVAIRWAIGFGTPIDLLFSTQALQ
jgi:O-antigen/teichoic acid export membrane protein